MLKKTAMTGAILILATTSLAYEEATPQRIPVDVPQQEVITAPATVSGTFYTGNFNWYYEAGGLQLSMRGYATTDTGGTIETATACLYNESAFTRRFSATVDVRQGTKIIQSIKFARDFGSQRYTCHTLSGFNAHVNSGEFSVVVGYDVLDDENVFLGLPATDSGQVFDVQIGSERPPHATGSQGPILIHGVGIRYLLVEDDEPPGPPPAGSCTRDATTACLLNDRFRVTVDWHTAGDAGTANVMYFGGSRAENNQSVFMWFFNPNNFEMGIKMVDACTPPFNHYWVFVSGLTNQGFTVRVEDTETSAVWTHSNPVGVLALTESDTEAFDCP